MNNPVKEFERVLAAQRVVDRFAMEFPTDDALKRYLEDHPNADRSKHRVNPDAKPSKKEQRHTSDRDHQKSEAYKTERKEGYYPQKMPEGMKLPSFPEGFKELAESMPDADLDKNKAYNHPAVKKLSKKLLSDLRSGKTKREQLEKESEEAHKSAMAFLDKQMQAKSDAEGDPYRFAGRKMFQVWRSYNDALQTYQGLRKGR